MIDELVEQLNEKEIDLAKLRDALLEVDQKKNSPGPEGAEARKKANDLIIEILKLESEIEERNRNIKLELHKSSEPTKPRMEGKPRIF